MSVLKKLDKHIKEESGGGGGIIGKASVDIGFKVFIGGMSNEDTFFTYDINDENAKEEAKKNATKLLDKKGLEGKRPQPSIQIVVFKDSVLAGNTDNWNNDQYTQEAFWTDDWLEIMRPGLEKAIEKADHLDDSDDVLGKTHWLRIGGKPTLTGDTYVDSKGEERPSMCRYTAEFYKNKSAAEDAAGDAQSGSSSDSAEESPPGMTAQNWSKYKDEILKEVATTELKEVCDDYGITDVTWLRRYCKKNDIEFTK